MRIPHVITHREMVALGIECSKMVPWGTEINGVLVSFDVWIQLMFDVKVDISKSRNLVMLTPNQINRIQYLVWKYRT